MERKTRYNSPCLEEIHLTVENVLGKSQEFPELPDHDWVKSKRIDVFPQEEEK